MSFMVSAFCVLRIVSWTLLAANDEVRNGLRVQNLLGFVRERTLIQTAVMVRNLCGIHETTT